MFRLDGKVAIVTGGARGIGRAVSEAFVRQGAKVAVVSIHAESAEKTVAELRALGGDCIAVPADCTQESQVVAMVQFVLSHFGRIDILVNNVGVARPGKIGDLTEEDWDRSFAVNVKTGFFCSKAVMPHMKEQRSGRIINIASVVGRTPRATLGAHYAATKAGVLLLTRSLAKELAPFGVTANAVAPGVTDTDGKRALTTPETEARLVPLIPLGRLGRPEDQAAAVVFLASDEASYVTGATIDVNGGFLMV